ncbi:MAG TPA: hypothetical protein VFF19_11715 [Reyranella sp.]|nr:hypothetical protein [Reyranella sp.]
MPIVRARPSAVVMAPVAVRPSAAATADGRIGERCQLDLADAVVEFRKHAARQFEGEAGLADSTGSRERHHPKGRDEDAELLQLGLAADQRRCRRRKVAARQSVLRTRQPSRRIGLFAVAAFGRPASDEPIAAAGIGLEQGPVRPQRLADRMDMDPQGVLLDDSPLPDVLDELVLADEPSSTPGQLLHDLERTRADRYRAAMGAQLTSIGVDLPRPFLVNELSEQLPYPPPARACLTPSLGTIGPAARCAPSGDTFVQ